MKIPDTIKFRAMAENTGTLDARLEGRVASITNCEGTVVVASHEMIVGKPYHITIADDKFKLTSNKYTLYPIYQKIDAFLESKRTEAVIKTSFVRIRLTKGHPLIRGIETPCIIVNLINVTEKYRNKGIAANVFRYLTALPQNIYVDSVLSPAIKKTLKGLRYTTTKHAGFVCMYRIKKGSPS